MSKCPDCWFSPGEYEPCEKHSVTNTPLGRNMLPPVVMKSDYDKLEAENKRLREGLEEFAKKQYKDSSIVCLLGWYQSRAKALLKDSE